MVDQTIAELAPILGTRVSCTALGRSRATYYRRHRQSPPPLRQTRVPTPQPRALSQPERAAVLGLLHEERFVDQAPASVYATLLDEGRYVCSVPTMYRVLHAADEVHERRRQARHPATVKPELVATAPNCVWSWDITKLLGPEKWTYYHLYVIIDIYSRYVPGWLLATRETAELAEHFIAETIRKHNVVADQLIIHADRGTSMASKTVALLLADLGVTKSHSRPHCSNDNPYSEAQFKTLKYRPEFPERFRSMEEARAFCREFFTWYNGSHRHSGIAFMTPEAVHYGRAEAVNEIRSCTLAAAFVAHPERFVRKPPVPRRVPTAVWINKPEERKEVDQ